MFERLTTLVINYSECPEFVKEEVRRCESYQNGVGLTHISEFEPDDQARTWDKSLTREKVVAYFNQQREDLTCKSDNLEDFVEEYGLEVEMWLISLEEDGHINLAGVELILFDVSW